MYEHTSVGDALRVELLDNAFLHASKLMGDENFTTDLKQYSAAQDFMVDLLKCSMVRTAILEGQKREDSVIIDAAQFRRETAEVATDNLVFAMENLPTECRSTSCTCTFDGLSFERKGPQQKEWTIRCKACRCRLVR